MSDPARRSVDPDKLKDFLKRKKESASAEVAEEIEVIEDSGSNAPTTGASNSDASNSGAFQDMPAFENVAVPPVRRPGTMLHANRGGGAGSNHGPSEEKIRDLEKLLKQVRLIGWAALLLLTVLITTEVAKPILAMFNQTDYEYMVYNIDEDEQYEIKDKFEIEGWELVSFGINSAYYKRAR